MNEILFFIFGWNMFVDFGCEVDLFVVWGWWYIWCYCVCSDCVFLCCFYLVCLCWIYWCKCGWLGFIFSDVVEVLFFNYEFFWCKSFFGIFFCFLMYVCEWVFCCGFIMFGYCGGWCWIWCFEVVLVLVEFCGYCFWFFVIRV